MWLADGLTVSIILTHWMWINQCGRCLDCWWASLTPHLTSLHKCNPTCTHTNAYYSWEHSRSSTTYESPALFLFTVATFIQGQNVGLLLSFNIFLPVKRHYNGLCEENTLAVTQSSDCVASEKHELWWLTGQKKSYCSYQTDPWTDVSKDELMTIMIQFCHNKSFNVTW